MNLANNSFFLSHADPMWIYDLKTLYFIAVNNAAIVKYGYSREDFLSMTIADIRPVEDRAAMLKNVALITDGRNESGVWQHRLKSGGLINVDIVGHTVQQKGRDAVLIVARDVSRLVIAEKTAQKYLEGERVARISKENLDRQFQILFDLVPGMYLVFSPENFDIVAVSEAYLETLNLTRVDVINCNLFDVLPEQPEDTAHNQLRASFERVMITGRLDLLEIQKFILPTGKAGKIDENQFWAISTTPVAGGSNARTFHLMLRIQDVTEAFNFIGISVNADDASTPLLANLDLISHTRELKSDNVWLAEQVLRLRTTQRLLNIGTWDYHIAQDRLQWSSTVYEMYGVTPENFGHTSGDYIALAHADDREAMVLKFDEFISSVDTYYEFSHKILHDDGEIVHLRGAAEKVETAKGMVLSGVVQNVTRYVEAAVSLSRANRLLEIAGTLAKFGAWRYDVRKNQIEWSTQTAQIHEETDGFSPTLEEGISYYSPEYRERIVALFDVCLDRGEPFNEVSEIINSKGNRLWVRTTGEVEYDVSGRTIGLQGSIQDITELLTVRQQAEESEKLLEIAGRTVKLGGWRVSLDDYKVFCTDGVARMLELPLGIIPNFDDVIKFFAPEFEDSARRVFNFGAMDGIPFDNVCNVITVKGNRIKVHIQGEPVWNITGKIIAVQGAMQDISELSAYQKKFDNLSNILTETLENIGDAFILLDRDLKFTYLNHRAEVLLKRSREQLIGRYIFDEFTEMTGTQFEIQSKYAFETGDSIRFDQFFPLLNRTFRMNAHPTVGAMAVYFLDITEELLAQEQLRLLNAAIARLHRASVERDITYRKRAEETLHISETRFRLIAKSTGNAVWEWDIASGKEWWSEGLNEIFGHQPDPDGTIPTVWRTNIHYEDKARIDDVWNQMLSGHVESMNERYRFRRADGNWATVEDRAFVICDTEKRAVRILGSMIDISERLHLEERLRHSQKLEAVGQLTGGIAHDFNNLLTIITGNTELLQENLEEGTALRKHADTIARAADHAAELTNRLVAFSRRQPLSPQVINANSVITNIEDMLRRSLGKYIEIEIVQAQSLWKTELDIGQFEASILNLAINSRDSMPNGGLLTIKTANASLNSAFESAELELKAGQYVVIAVSDTGFGIPHEHLDSVFEPFYTTKAVGKGTGLGLSMVYGFVQQSGGHIRIYSEPDQGTTVKMYFPRSFGEEFAVEVEAEKNQLPRGNETILVVEDDDLILQQLCAQLVELGYNVIASTEGKFALAIIRERADIDLLFTDVILPGGMNGRQIADDAQAIRPGLKVLYTSGHSATAIIREGRLDLGVELLSKPYRRAELAFRLRKVLDS